MECFTTATGVSSTNRRDNDKQPVERAIRLTTSSDESRTHVGRHHAPNRMHLSKRFASPRFGTFVCAARGVHAAAGHGHVNAISPTRDTACVARMDARETLRMCNADPERKDASESGVFRTDDGERRFSLRGHAHAPNDARRRVSQRLIGRGSSDSSD
jgi:hypothetical protein